MHLGKRIEFTGAATDVFVDLTKPEGRLDIRVSLEQGGIKTPLGGVKPVMCDAASEVCLSPLHMGQTGADGLLQVR